MEIREVWGFGKCGIGGSFEIEPLYCIPDLPFVSPPRGILGDVHDLADGNLLMETTSFLAAIVSFLFTIIPQMILDPGVGLLK